ncbi:MAG: hypothetical protein QNJ92_17090 [Alphaproteobacteria bacterium]|nr:hypothetical protein [Alphaproteobacteria bacterium]
MVWRFLKHYGMSKATDILDEFATAVVAFDPQAASQAQVAMMEAELNKLGNRLAEAEAELRREHRETQELKQNYDQYLQAAQVLQTKLADAEDPAKSAEMEASLAKIINQLELMKPEIEREEREDQEVEAWRSELRRAFEELAGKIRTAHSELKAAQRHMDMAKLQKERAVEQERRSMDAAQLTGSISSLSVALDAMNQETAKVRAETEALKLKAGLFQSDRIDGDPNVAQALATVRGNTSVTRGSLSDRLAALNSSRNKPNLVSAA